MGFIVLDMTKESSQIRAMEYDASRSVLRVHFQRGGTYEYEGVNPDLIQSLIGADSIGSFFNKHIKNRYRTFRLEHVSGIAGVARTPITF